MIDNQLQSNADLEHAETEQKALVPAAQQAQLIKYDSACRALAEASGTDEVKDILDRALKLKLYAKIAENKQMEREAVAIRVRAERRLGEMMKEQGETVGKAKGGAEKGVGRRGNAGSDKTHIAPPALAEAGIDKNLGHRARKLAKLPKKEFEKRVADMLNGNRGSLDIKRAAKPVKHSVVRVDHADSHMDGGHADGGQRPPDRFFANAEKAESLAQYDGPLVSDWAKDMATWARNVAAKWAALADRFEQANREAEQHEVVGRGDEEDARG